MGHGIDAVRRPPGSHPAPPPVRREADELRGRILDLPRDDRWATLARAALREDLHAVHSALTADVVQSSPGGGGRDDVQRWVETIDAAALR